MLKALHMTACAIAALGTFVSVAFSATNQELVATVGPGATIKLTFKSGDLVKQVRRGTYVIVVRDRSVSRNFHLSGTGGFTKRTGVAFRGTVLWKVTLGPGAYRYFSDRPPVNARSFKVK